MNEEVQLTIILRARVSAVPEDLPYILEEMFECDVLAIYDEEV